MMVAETACHVGSKHQTKGYGPPVNYLNLRTQNCTFRVDGPR